MKKPASATKRGRPAKFTGGSTVLSVAVGADVAEDLRRFMGYLVSVDGARRSQGDVLTEALRAYPPFKAWKKGQKGAPG
jgi:hypothetical protein